MNGNGYCVKVLVKTADATIGTSWELAPLTDSGEYIFKTEDEAKKYALSEYGEASQWKIIPFKMSHGNQET